MQNNTQPHTCEVKQYQMHGAAIIDHKGKETPITDDMVKQALNSILKTCQPLN